MGELWHEEITTVNECVDDILSFAPRAILALRQDSNSATQGNKRQQELGTEHGQNLATLMEGLKKSKKESSNFKEEILNMKEETPK